MRWAATSAAGQRGRRHRRGPGVRDLLACWWAGRRSSSPLLKDSGYSGVRHRDRRGPGRRRRWTSRRRRRSAKKRNSSIRIAANCVRDGRAEGLVSAGHTGAAMVSAKMVIGTIEGVDRPALATRAAEPDRATACCSTSAPTRTPRRQHFREFAVMGSIYAAARLRQDDALDRPDVDRRGGLQGDATARRRPSRS